MKHSLARWGTACLVALALAACGGGGGSSGNSTQTATPPANSSIAAAAALPANDSASNSSAPFTVLQGAGIASVTINSLPKVNFTVFSDGAVKTGLTVANVSFAIAKLVPGSNGEPDQWVNYIYRKETATTGVGPGGKPVLASAMQATTDGKQTDAALLAAQLVYNADGYYTYTFKTDIKDPTQTNGVVYEPTRTHRVAIQLSYKNAAGETVLVNPYVDFTMDASGKSVLVTDPTKTRKMTDVSSCNSCHEKLALHGGGRVDTQYCVLCHNPGTTDANSGNNLNLATMVHKIHAGQRLGSQLATGGEDYTIWGYQNSKHSYAEVGFPQDLRNCSKCHSGANPSTPQGDNWKTRPSKEACLTCHASAVGSAWESVHKIVAVQLGGAGAAAMALPNSQCLRCHGAGTAVAAERVHWNQVEASAAKYKMNIESVAFNDTPDHKARSVTVKYFLSDPTNSNAAYNLVTSECTGSAATLSCPSTTKFGNLRFYLAYQNMIGQMTGVTEYSAYNNGGNAANAYAYKGSNDGSNHYTVSVPVPDDSAVAVARGTARVVSIGQVKENKLSAISAADPRTQVQPAEQVNIVVQHAYQELALSGTLQPRRTIVSNEKCNACHSALGAASGSNTLANAFHSGGRTVVEACVVCHDANRVSTTVMTNGLALNESYQFKRMIHGIHGSSRRAYPFTAGNSVVDAFNLDGTSMTGGPSLSQQKDSTGKPIVVTNFAAEVKWPGASMNCNACHVDNSYQRDQSALGAVVKKATGVTDPNLWKVISPKAATCTSCHDGKTASGGSAITHVINFGGATFGDRTQAEIALQPGETCDDCHASGGSKDVDIVHGLK